MVPLGWASTPPVAHLASYISGRGIWYPAENAALLQNNMGVEMGPMGLSMKFHVDLQGGSHFQLNCLDNPI